MKVTIQTSELALVENFFEFLKKRAADPEHIPNHDCIAEFVDKVLVVEMKRTTNALTVVDQEIDIPDDVLLEPLRRAKAQLDETFDDFLKGKGGRARPVTANESSLATGQTDKTEEVDDQGTVTTRARRNGNGHKSLKKRDLTGTEKDELRCWFVGMNGCVADDNCMTQHRTMDKDVSVFQVTGFATYLHYEVARNNIQLNDMDKYWDFMKQHQNVLYNSPKYQAAIAQGKSGAKPKFASGFPKRRP